METKLPQEVLEILNKLKEYNYQIYIVGGAVRDLILGKEVKDWDFTTDAKPEEILKLFTTGFYDNKFGTVGVPISSTRGVELEERANVYGVYEVTTMRKEGDYHDHRHPAEIAWTNKIEEDLARRDFTINALAMDANLKVIDPFNGKEDLENKLIRAVGDPNQRFKEDALRLMRAIRIATELEFEIEKETFLAITKNVELIKEIAWERIRDELFKILSSANPYIGIIKLREAGILEIILPEVEKCFGIYQEGPKHEREYDIGEHLLLSLRYIPSKNPLVRFATLLHDIGKVETFKKDSTGNVTFYNHEVAGGRLVLSLAKRFNLSKKQTDKLFKLVRFHMFTVTEHQTDSAIRRFIKNVGLENVNDLMSLRVGDRLGGGTEKEISWRMQMFRQRIDEVLKKPFSITDLKINGKDVMKALNIPSGPKVGEILQKLFEEVLEDSEKNKREYLLERIKKI